MVGHYLNDSVRWQFEAFQRGFGVICNGPVLRLFNAQVRRPGHSACKEGHALPGCSAKQPEHGI